ncbi:MAG: DUF6252 family protein [Gemmatimonadota bacterium]|nr:DUF6252 family protein [Gemmatimonadota bacterium]MDH3421709.1 DUF6252 family protein [Gemmatimonadota bacterium]
MSQSRTRPFLSAVTMVVVSTLVACGGDDPAGLGVVGTGPMSAMVDGVQWTATVAFATNTGGIVGVGGSGATGEGIGFAFQGSTTGTYSIGTGNVHSANYTFGSNSWVAGNTVGSGSIVVTTLDATRVAGTFSFEAVSATGGTPATRSITQGAFDVTF